MDVVQVNTTDGRGGAARVVRRLHDGLSRAGVRSSLAVGESRLGNHDLVSFAEETGRFGRLVGFERYLPKLTRFSGELALPHASTRLFERTRTFQRADVIHLHNLHGNYFDIRVLPRWARSTALVLTLHDLWDFTGHCAYSFGCERWRSGCGPCPLFEPGLERLDEIPQPAWDNSGSGWRLKQRLYERTPMTVTAPSRWLLERAEQSILATHPSTTFHQIPLGLDTDAFRPIPQEDARRLLGLPIAGELLLFAAASPGQERKGFRYLLEALASPILSGRPLSLMVLGAVPAELAATSSIHALGEVHEERLQAVVYGAADVVVVPSLADNQPLVALEAMACGTPVVASSVGGLGELVGDEETGLRVPPGDSPALASAIARLLDDEAARRRMSEAARELAVAEHGMDRWVRAHLELYDRVTSATPSTGREAGSADVD